MVGTGSSNGGLINGDDGTIGVGDQVGVEVEGAAVAVSNWGSVSNRDGSDRSGSNNGTSSSKGSSLGGEVVGTGSSNSGLVNGDHGTVGVGDKMGVEVEGAGVAIARSIGTSVANSGNRSSSNDRGSNGKSSSLGGEVVSTGSSNSRLVNWDHGTVGVGDQVGVEVEGAGVAVSRGVGRGSCVANVSNGGGSVSNGASCNNGSSSELGRKMVGLQSGHTGLVDGSDRSVGVTLQAKEALGGGERETGSENLKENFNSLFTQDSLLELTRNFMMYLAVC